MGIYSANRFSSVPYDYASDIPANEAYGAAFGCAHVLADCQANDMALFESAIWDDMHEVMSIQEGVEVLNENAFTDVIKKIIEMFKKLIAKIKGIFKAFIAKLDGLAKNGKDLVKKYEKQILKYSNWKEYKVKIRTPKGNSNDSTSLINTLFAVSSGTKTIKDIEKRYAVNTIDIAGAGWDSGLGESLKTPEKIKNADADDIKEAILKTYIAESKASVCSDYKDFSENVTDELWDDEETLDGDDDNISSSTFTAPWIKGVLEDKKLITDAEKLNKKLDDNINNIIDRLGKTHTELANLMSKEGTDSYAAFEDDSLKFGSASVSKDGSYKSPKDGTKFTKGLKGRLTDDEYDAASAETKNLYDSTPGNHTLKAPNIAGVKATEVQKIIVAMQKIASNEQEVVTKVTSEYMAQLKFAVSQARKMWASAAAYTSTQHKEDASYYQAVGECAAEQAYQKFEAIHS